MQLTRESRRAHWLILLATWITCAVLAWLHAAAVSNYVGQLDRQGLPEGAAARTPLRQVIPARFADAQMWVRHALAGEEAQTARVRFTRADNAPAGREVHWSSALPWLLRGGAAMQRAATGQTGAAALESTLPWLNTALLLGVVGIFSWWVAARAGAVAGAIVALGLIGHPRLYGGFTPYNVDHHGLATAAALGLLLGVAFMGAGWWQPTPQVGRALLPTSREQARRAAIASALCGAIGLWLSAAALLPVIALAGAAGLGAAWRRGRAAHGEGAHFEPALWRLWGRLGAAASLVFYFIEYAPSNLSLRLEVNHPLHALAWWGGAEIVAVVTAWRIAAPPLVPTGAPRRLGRQLLWPVLAVAAAPLTVLIGGRAVFLVADPFVGELRHYVAEGRSLPATLAQAGLRPLLFDLASVLLLVPVGFALRRASGANALLLSCLGLVCAALVAMAFLEMRWWLNVGAAQLTLLLVLLVLAAPRSRWLLPAAALLLLAPAVERIVTTRAENRAQLVAAGDLLQPLYRDIAAALRASQPDGPILLLASPNASAGIGYFGRFQTLGTLYWENAAGLRAAAEIFSAPTSDEALARLRMRQITHIAMISTANFLGEYFRLLHPGASPEAARQTFGYGLLANQPAPPWLQPVPYRCPPELKADAPTVRLFKVEPDQTDAERLYHTAIARVAEGDQAAAEQVVAELIARAPAPAHAEIYEATGSAFYDYGADAAAVRLFRRRLAISPDPTVATTTAWILATTRDDALRDGPAALALLDPQRRNPPDDITFLSAFAAAAAETGRFPDARAAAQRALALASAAGDKESEGLLRRRLESYRAGRPWRQ